MENNVIFNNWKNDLENCKLIDIIDCLRILELNVCNICNLKCPFCPQSIGFKHKIKFIDIKIIDEIYNQLNSINYSGYICIAGHGEPTLHPNILYILKKLSKFKVILVTNGTQFNNDIWKYISSLCQIKVSVHFWNKIDEYKKLFNGTNAIFRNHDMIHPEMNLFNRAGNIDNSKENEHHVEICNYLFYKIMIDIDGRYARCEADWNNETITKYTCYDVSIKDYFENKLNDDRKHMLNEKHRQNLSCCKKCDINGHLAGNCFVNFIKNKI